MLEENSDFPLKMFASGLKKKKRSSKSAKIIPEEGTFKNLKALILGVRDSRNTPQRQRCWQMPLLLSLTCTCGKVQHGSK